MKTLLLSSVLMLASSISYGKASAPTTKSLTSLMQEVRDPFYDSAKRQQYLNFTQTHMKTILARELETTPLKLTQKFMEDKTHMDHLWSPNWIELQTEYYTTLHQETLHQRWIEKTKKKTITDYGENIARAMVLHLGKYSGTKEGLLYNRWDSLTVSKNGKKSNHRIPHFVFGHNAQSLIQMDAHTDYEDILPKTKDETPGNPSLSTLLKNTEKKSREDIQELAEIIQLNHRIYIRAVANSAKTIAAVHYLTGEYTLAQTENKVAGFVDDYCEGCNAKEKDFYKKAALNYVKNTKAEFAQAYTTKTILSTFCSDLKNNGYIFPKKPDFTKKPIDLYERPSIAIDNTRVYTGNRHAQLALVRLSALRKAVAEHDLGVLFLTKSLSNMTAKEDVSGTWLSCQAENEASDISRIKGAIGEAQSKVEQYITLIGKKVKASVYQIDAATETLEYFSQTNVSATAEAVMTFPQGINHVIQSVLNLDQDVKRRKRVDTAVAWGGTIVGVGLTISGIGAPEGAVVLIAVAAMTKGAIWGSYYMYRSHQEKAFFNELASAKAGLGNNFYLDENISQHYAEYRSLRLSYITEFASAAFQFAKIHKLALVQSKGDVVKAHGLIRRVFQKARAISQDVGQDKMTELLVSSTF